MYLPQNSSFLFSSPGQIGVFCCIYFMYFKAIQQTPATYYLSAESLHPVMMAHSFLYTIFSKTEYIVSLVFADIQNCLQLNNEIFFC